MKSCRQVEKLISRNLFGFMVFDRLTTRVLSEMGLIMRQLVIE